MNCRLSFPIADTPFRRSSEFVKSPFRYPGGKYYALSHILPFLLAVPHDEYREPFVGGGSVFFAKPKASKNWINDLEADIVETYKVMADPKLRQQLADRIRTEVASRDRHKQVKDMQVESLIDRAFKTFYLNRTSYSGIINKPAWGYADAKSAPPSSWATFIGDAGAKLKDVQITSLDFEDVITLPAVGTTVLMYLDPPYYHADQKRAYTKPFTIQDHHRLAQLLQKNPHLFCLSYDDCDEIRSLYSWAEIYEVSWLYNTANLNGKARKSGQELIITNYKIQKKSILQPFLL